MLTLGGITCPMQICLSGGHTEGGGEGRETMIREAKQLVISAFHQVSEEMLLERNASLDVIALYKEQARNIADDLERSELHFITQDNERASFVINGEEKTFKTTHQSMALIDINMKRVEELNLAILGAATLFAREGARHVGIQEDEKLRKIEEMALGVLDIYQSLEEKHTRSESEFKDELIKQLSIFSDIVLKKEDPDFSVDSLKLNILEKSSDYQTCINPGWFTRVETHRIACERIIDVIKNIPIEQREQITNMSQIQDSLRQAQASIKSWLSSLSEPEHQIYSLFVYHMMTKRVAGYYNTIDRTLRYSNAGLYQSCGGAEGEPDHPLIEMAPCLLKGTYQALKITYPTILSQNKETFLKETHALIEVIQKSGFNVNPLLTLYPMPEFENFKSSLCRKLESLRDAFLQSFTIQDFEPQQALALDEQSKFEKWIEGIQDLFCHDVALFSNNFLVHQYIIYRAAFVKEYEKAPASAPSIRTEKKKLMAADFNKFLPLIGAQPVVGRACDGNECNNK